MNQIKIGIALTLFFIILTEKLNLLNALAGLAVCLLVGYLNRRHFPDYKSISFKTLPLWFHFVALLFKEVIVSNLQVAKIALSRNMDIHPTLQNHQSRLGDPFLLAIYANAITLTPGTMTVDIEGQQLRIHCLNDAYAKGIENSRIENILLEIEGEMHE